jgi:hypothetical protein
MKCLCPFLEPLGIALLIVGVVAFGFWWMVKR